METNIKTILLAVQQRLAERVPELAYIDKNWGQLDYEAPPVKWPCALLDIDDESGLARSIRLFREGCPPAVR